MLKVIGRKTSSNVMKVLWACAELELEFEREAPYTSRRRRSAPPA